ncbi:MAG TPA: response regulator transcription factor [Oculatellaceae cyanobacterium]
MPKVLIVEDDLELSSKIREWLEFERYSVEECPNGADAAELLKTYGYDVIVCDWNLPDKTGVDIISEFRSHGGGTPILMLTGKGTVTDKETGLDAGADDYLTKPFHIKELAARLKALLRRPAVMAPETIKVGEIELETRTYKVTVAGKSIQLLPKELALLDFLIRRPNQVFGSKELLKQVWESDTVASEDTIRTYMKTLRRKVTPEGAECPIKTVHGLGYKLEA